MSRIVSRKLSHLVAGLLMLHLLSASGQAQAPPSPGVQYAGRHIGFAPKNGRVHPAPPPRQRQTGNLTAAESLAKSIAGVGSSNLRTANAQVARAGLDVGIPTPIAEGEYVEDSPMIVDDGGTYCDSPGVFVNGGSCNSEYGCMQPMLWGGVEYLYWWTKGMQVPALATTSPTGTAQDSAGVLGQLGTTTLFGNETLNESGRSGMRYRLGLWLDPCQQTGLEFSYLNLSGEQTNFSASNPVTGILARPFQDVVAASQDARLIVFPNLVSGSLNIAAETDFQTAEVLMRRASSSCHWTTLDYYFGYRYAELEDTIGITESTISLAAPTTDTAFDLSDRFHTQNEFHGGQIGVRATRCSSPLWSVEFLGKFALGNTRSRTSISGQTVVTPTTGDASTQAAGLLTQTSNIGQFEASELSTIIECGATLRRHLSDNVAFTFGYTFFLWTDVARAGDQIDTGLNVSQIPPGTLTGEARPAVTSQLDDFWAQGLRVGMELGF
ncbi:MAG: BBP7 family outer membrane beta-barrel protein [Planctomycetales bacterium]|nr:BBP7 family outer membrane beta-barrel protein [Planctomycetales bacterium]